MKAYRFGDDWAASQAPMSAAEWRSLMSTEPWDDTYGALDEVLEAEHREAIDREVARLEGGPDAQDMAHLELMGAFDWRGL